MNSFDHYAIGSVGEWMYRYILGINPDENHPGYEHFTIHPRLGGTLTWAKGSYHSIRGTITSSWKIDAETFTLSVTIPANTSATVVLPATDPKKISINGQAIKKFRHAVKDQETAVELGSGDYLLIVRQ
jgi:alpha-L-rhamnosidase